MEVTSSAAGSRSPGSIIGGQNLDTLIHFLDGQRMQAMLTAAGSGQLRYDLLAVTRWRGDPICGHDGVFVYLRDLDDGRFWSTTWQPTATEPEDYTAEFSATGARYARLDFDIAAGMEVQVYREADVELRRCTITNVGKVRRRMEVTSYLEWVLQDSSADYAHPAFSKLFVETDRLAEANAVIARRRQRDPRQAILCGAHWIAEISGRALRDATEFETSRLNFIGRGRSLRTPRALTQEHPLTGTSGPVLDPIASLRRSFILHPAESATITFATTARTAGAELSETIARPLSLSTVNWQARTSNGKSPASRRRVENHDAHRRVIERDDDVLRVDSPHGAPRPLSYRRLRENSGRARRQGATSAGEPLQFDNGLGGFTQTGEQYVIRLQPDDDGNLELPPLPWSHVVANPNAGFIATELGAGYAWTANSRENRLTHWMNDPVTDPHVEALYLRDAERGVYWSPLAGPAAAGVPHEVRYGFGFVQYSQTSAGLEQRVLQFVPTQDSVKITRVALANTSTSKRQMDLFAYAHLALGNGTRDSTEAIRVKFDEACGALFATNPTRELSGRVAFAKLLAPAAAAAPHFTASREEFIGPQGDLAEPLAVATNRPLSDCTAVAGDACFALQQALEIEKGAVGEYWILLGEAESESEARQIISRYSQADQLDAAFAAVRNFWQNTLGAVRINTPSAAMNVMVNGWLPYQNISCRLWGRSAYYQSGGAYGFRDQLQDAASLVYHWPQLTREQILRHAASQFVEGDVLHWWHPPNHRGIRTRFSDDLLWLPLFASEYAATTGDAQLWDETASYVAGPQLEPGEQERFLAVQTSGLSGTVYEHCCRAIDRSLAVGAHGLPLMGCGDWNDGMNRIGEGGRGESVWMGFFLYLVLDAFIPVCQSRGDATRAEQYRQHQRRLRSALNGVGWDGQWYRRAFFDDGEVIGAASADECQIDALAQAWAVLSGAGEPDKVAAAMAAVEERLVDQQAGLIRLLDPPFDRLRQDPGYIKGYVPGVRENGGQYTHGVLWFVRALAELGRGSRAVELLDMINPVHHSRTPAEVAVYQAEPYVVAADVYSQPPHVGRAGWTWYTGSAGWMWRVAVESILGLRVRHGRTLLLNPALSRHWPMCELRYSLPDGATVYHVCIENPHQRESGVSSATLDGQPAAVNNGVAEVPLLWDGQVHQVAVRL